MTFHSILDSITLIEVAAVISVFAYLTIELFRELRRGHAKREMISFVDFARSSLEVGGVITMRSRAID